MSGPRATPTPELEASLRRSERALSEALSCLEQSLRESLSPRRLARDHLPLLLVGGFLVGLAAGRRTGAPPLAAGRRTGGLPRATRGDTR